MGLSGSAGQTEGDCHTVMPSVEIFSNGSSRLVRGVPMRTAGICRLLHQFERVLE